MGGRRAAHRARDQESADADPAFGRTPQTPLRRHIVEGKDVFDQCTDTIIRQVDDIKRMVDEFSNFARMPKARLARDDLSDCVRQAMFLARVGRPEIAIEEDMPGDRSGPNSTDGSFRRPSQTC